MEKVIDNDTTQVIFNGKVYLARHRHISSMFLGSGKTYQEAIDKMDDTIFSKNFKWRDKPYF